MMRLIRLLVFLGALAGLAPPAFAQLAFELRTGDATTGIQSVPIDSNNCANAGPRAIYVGGIVTNTSAATATGITATMTGLGNGFFLAGGQPAGQALGALAPGQSTGVYWFVGYGCSVDANTTPSIALTSSAGSLARQISLTARSSISANAGGNVAFSTLGPGAVVGQTIWFDTSYDFGGTDVGHEFLLQPTGGQGFDAACFRLVGTEIRRSNIAPIAVGTRNRLYFRQTQKQPGNGYYADVRYFFEYQCAGASTTARPYATMTSGNSLKYTGNFDGSGSISIAFPGATNPFAIAKSADIARGVAGAASTVTYTVTVSNPSVHAARVSQFVDTLPAGATFLGLDAASEVTAANSSIVPAAGATGTLSFVGRQDVSYFVPAGGSVKLVYKVRMPSAVGTYVNSAHALFGSAATPTATAGFEVFVPPPLTLVKASEIASDPVNGTAAPKAIPGGRITYTVTVSNPHDYAVTSDSVAVIDTTPANMRLLVGNLSGNGGPVLFQNGGGTSGLSYTFAGLGSSTDDLDFSNDGGASWSYAPTLGADGTDPNVTHIRIRPKGSMAPESSFTLLLGYVIG